MSFLTSFKDYSREPKEAPKNLEQDPPMKIDLHYATDYCQRQLGISSKERNLLLFAINLVPTAVYDLNSPSRT